ncbi:hypothetical protein GCQ56_19770 [Marinifilum sp. N1E240]|uniref:hypothetical protein n=1 Tax=Marinifilum sp. N1E240 TaxID=2608082 RepID=UPI00128D2D8E|nr:hypothetical protein [Marinifilum sp. N1E240]MPQ49245.1 hypothetical protein [Marinifilum sp. N1E240]
MLIIIGVLILLGIIYLSTKNEKVIDKFKFEQKISPIEFEQDFENIKVGGGTLRFWGNWFGRPMDNFHQIKKVEFNKETGRLILILDKGERVTVKNPSELKIGKNEFRIEKADEILFEWNFYGENKTEENLKSESYVNDGMEIKTDFRKKANCSLKEPAFRIIGR